jgi:predicted transcriptional regulator
MPQPREARERGIDPDRAVVTPAPVARVERDEIEPRMTTLRKLAWALEVDPAELIE